MFRIMISALVLVPLQPCHRGARADAHEGPLGSSRYQRIGDPLCEQPPEKFNNDSSDKKTPAARNAAKQEAAPSLGSHLFPRLLLRICHSTPQPRPSRAAANPRQPPKTEKTAVVGRSELSPPSRQPHYKDRKHCPPFRSPIT